MKTWTEFFKVASSPVGVGVVVAIGACAGFIYILANAPGMKPPEYNQTLQNEVFKECLQVLPLGPDKTVYNDWAEVVSECRGHARNISYIQR